MSAVSAFNWKEYTDQEHAKHGDPFKDIKRNAAISANMTEGLNKIREKNPSHGTIFGITEKNISTRAPDMMEKKNDKGKRKDSTRRKHAANGKRV